MPLFDGYTFDEPFTVLGPQGGCTCRLLHGEMIEAPAVYRIETPQGPYLLRTLMPCPHDTLPAEAITCLQQDVDGVIVHGAHPHVHDLALVLQEGAYRGYLYEWDDRWITLRQRLDTRRPFARTELLSLLRDLLLALRALHTRGLTHLMVRPENILLRPDGTACITDLGLHRVYFLTSMGVPIPERLVRLAYPYMAPEVLDDASQAGPAADLWSLGVVMFQMLHQRLPYFPSTNVTNRYAWRDAACTVLQRGDITDPLFYLIRRCLSVDPMERYRGEVADLHAAFDAMLNASDTVVVQDTNPAGIPQNDAAPETASNAPTMVVPADTTVEAASRMTGRVKLFNRTKYYGFIIADDRGVGRDVFFHGSQWAAPSAPQPNAPVMFTLVYDGQSRPTAHAIEMAAAPTEEF